MFSEEFLSILRCPFDRTVRLEAGEGALVCQRCRTQFPVREGIPSLLRDEAKLPPGCSSARQLPCQQAEAKAPGTTI